ncbi:MAG: helix-turn-helix domain-containing protein [Sphingosinicella sp.]|nr:helix-turn-helix domain-containing protein [Sphingosinicella sp.]
MSRPEAQRNLAQLAQKARLSESHFRKLFRETHGETWHAMQNRALMQKACEIGLHSGWSMTRIADELGFSKTSTTSRAPSNARSAFPRCATGGKCLGSASSE